MLLKHADPVHKVTIIPRGRAGGYTLMLPKEDRNYATKSELLDRLKVAMGGRVAEEIVLKEISTGASQDIQQATRMVRGMVMQYGMSDVLGPVAYGESQNHQVFLGRDINHERNYSEEVASEIDKEVRKYLEEAYEACRVLITENRDKLELIAQALIERETLTAKQLEELLTTGKLADDDEKKSTDPLDFEKKKDDWSFFDPAPIEEGEQQTETDAADKGNEETKETAADEKTDQPAVARYPAKGRRRYPADACAGSRLGRRAGLCPPRLCLLQRFYRQVRPRLSRSRPCPHELKLRRAPHHAAR
jgi:cell division protease FtsH